MTFWGKANKKLNWWPMDITLENIARKTFTRAKLLRVITAYKLSNCETGSPLDSVETFRDRSPIHSSANIPVTRNP